jgi:DNA recombination protein RmuC
MENTIFFIIGFFSGIITIFLVTKGFETFAAKILKQNALEEAKNISALETQIKLISENNQKICEEANNLTHALKGHVKTQGNWGEMILTRLLEASGLIEGLHFSAQESFRDEENKVQRPDVIIKLPNDRHLIIDSKVSLIAYEKYYNSENNNETFLKEHINSVKDHIKGLKSKIYQDLKDINSPDFVLMFIPVEGAFNLIFQEDNGIIEYAWNNKVLPVSPSTLLITLKTIELFWKHEKQTQNVIEIAEESGKLYDKFVGLLCDLDNIKACIDKTSECFESAKRKLDGRGNLISQVEKLRELGAKTSKSIPDKHFTDSNF